MTARDAELAWVDTLPPDRKALVCEFGVWPVLLAWGRGLRGDALRRELAA